MFGNTSRLRPVATTLSIVAFVLLSTGCKGLKARDNINSGTAAFKAGNFAEAVDHFKTAVQLDPTIPNVRIYLATAYLQQFVPGTETAENKKYAQAALQELQETLKEDPRNLLATQYVANLYYQMKDFPNAEVWNKKVVELDPKNKEAFYTLGVIPWTAFYAADRETEIAEKLPPDYQGPIKDPKARAALREKHYQPLTEGIEYEKKALAVDPEYENAMSYMNLLYRYRAKLADSKDVYDSEIKEADKWFQKALETMKIKADRKANAANPK